MAFGIKDIRETVSDTAGKLAATARNTQAAIYGIAAIAVTALIVAVVAIALAARGRKAATA